MARERQIYRGAWERREHLPEIPILNNCRKNIKPMHKEDIISINAPRQYLPSLKFPPLNHSKHDQRETPMSIMGIINHGNHQSRTIKVKSKNEILARYIAYQWQNYSPRIRLQMAVRAILMFWKDPRMWIFLKKTCEVIANYAATPQRKVVNWPQCT